MWEEGEGKCETGSGENETEASARKDWRGGGRGGVFVAMVIVDYRCTRL